MTIGKTIGRILIWLVILLLLLILGFLTWFYFRYGGSGKAFPAQINSKPVWPADSLHIVASLPEPPGNIAVSREGRIFCTYHAESRPDVKVWELVNGLPVPFPDSSWQSAAHGKVFFDAIFSVRIDAQDRLWTLDHGQNGFRQPRLLCFDIIKRELIKQIDLPDSIAGIGSFVQDMQIDTACEKIYLADLSAFGKTPAIIVVDIATNRCRRLLENHQSLLPGDYRVVNKGRKVAPAGFLYHFHPAVDPIGLDRQNQWLYFGPMSGEWLYRVRIGDLNDENLNAVELGRRVERYAWRIQCDGITMDEKGNIYITDIENGAIGMIDTARNYHTLVAHSKMRWPDGMSYGPDGFIYVTDSDIPDIMLRSKKHIHAFAPYYVWKFRGLNPAAQGQ